jgi:hypothetical protein
MLGFHRPSTFLHSGKSSHHCPFRLVSFVTVYFSQLASTILSPSHRKLSPSILPSIASIHHPILPMRQQLNSDPSNAEIDWICSVCSRVYCICGPSSSTLVRDNFSEPEMSLNATVSSTAGDPDEITLVPAGTAPGQVADATEQAETAQEEVEESTNQTATKSVRFKFAAAPVAPSDLTATIYPGRTVISSSWQNEDAPICSSRCSDTSSDCNDINEQQHTTDNTRSSRNNA